MAHHHSFAALALAVREVRTMQAGRARRWEKLAGELAEKGELPAFDLSGLRVQLVQLHEVERLLVVLAPHETAARRLAPELMQEPGPAP